MSVSPRLPPRLQDGSTLLRHIVNRRRDGVSWRSTHPYVLADKVEWSHQDQAARTGTLAVTGFIRGGRLDVNKLVHVPGYGDFQLDRVTRAVDTKQMGKQRHKGNVCAGSRPPLVQTCDVWLKALGET